MLFNTALSDDDRRQLIAGKSSAIENARFICILLMTYVHLPLFDLAPSDTVIAARAIVADIFGRSSVPLLSVVSGLLIVPFYARRSWATGIRERARSLIVPMIAVNALALLLFTAPERPLLELLLGVNGKPMLIYMAFLRDLFVLCVLAPAMIWLVRRAPLVIAVLGLTYYLANIPTPIIVRPQIAGFFLLGIFVAIWGGVRIPVVPVLAAFAMVLFIEVTVHPHAQFYDLAVRRPVTAAAFWIFASHARQVPRFGRAVFLFFLLHGIMFHALGYLLSRQPVPFDNLILWLMVPPACFAIVVLGLHGWKGLGRRLSDTPLRPMPPLRGRI